MWINVNSADQPANAKKTKQANLILAKHNDKKSNCHVRRSGSISQVLVYLESIEGKVSTLFIFIEKKLKTSKDKYVNIKTEL